MMRVTWESMQRSGARSPLSAKKMLNQSSLPQLMQLVSPSHT